MICLMHPSHSDQEDRAFNVNTKKKHTTSEIAFSQMILENENILKIPFDIFLQKKNIYKNAYFIPSERI